MSPIRTAIRMISFGGVRKYTVVRVRAPKRVPEQKQSTLLYDVVVCSGLAAMFGMFFYGYIRKERRKVTHDAKSFMREE